MTVKKWNPKSWEGIRAWNKIYVRILNMKPDQFPQKSAKQSAQEHKAELAQIFDVLDDALLARKKEVLDGVKSRFSKRMLNMHGEVQILYAGYLAGLARAQEAGGELGAKATEMAKADFEDKIAKLKEELQKLS